jgi:hypothetical protein
MPQTQILGGGQIQPGVPLAVDPTFLAARVALRPLDYANVGQLLGHYAATQVSGATVSLGAAAHSASLRWTDTTRFLVLMRIKAGWSVTGAVTAATPMDMQAVIARGFSVDFTTNSTQLSLAAVTNTNKMRAGMGTSLLGASGPRILTTAAMSGQTLTADVAPFAITVWNNQPSGNATVTQAVGVSGPMQTIYEWTALGQHPVVLTANEGVLLQPVTAGPTTGTVKYYVQWEWAEVLIF